MENRTSIKEISEIIGVSDRRIQQLVKEGIIPKSERGKYCLKTTVQSYIAYLNDRIPGNAASVKNYDYNKEKARKIKAEADIAEVEAAKRLGEVAPIDEFERATSMLMASIRQNMMNIPGRAVMQLLGETDENQFKTKLADEIFLALENASQTEIEFDYEED